MYLGEIIDLTQSRAARSPSFEDSSTRPFTPIVIEIPTKAPPLPKVPVNWGFWGVLAAVAYLFLLR